MKKDVNFRLPIHNALLFGATLQTIRLLISCKPSLVTEVDPQSQWLLIHFASFHNSPRQVQIHLADEYPDSIDIPSPYTATLPIEDRILVQEKRHQILRMIAMCYSQEGGDEAHGLMRGEWEKKVLAVKPKPQPQPQPQPKKKKAKKGAASSPAPAPAGDADSFVLNDGPGKSILAHDEGMQLAYRAFCLAGIEERVVGGGKGMKVVKIKDSKIARTILSYVFLTGRLEQEDDDDDDDDDDEDGTMVEGTDV